MIHLLIACRAAIVALRALARGRSDLLNIDAGGPSLHTEALAATVRGLRATAWSALAELGRLAAEHALTLPVAALVVVAAWGEEDAEHDASASAALRMWARDNATPLDLPRCSCWLLPGPPHYGCVACAGIGHVIPEPPPPVVLVDACASRRAAWTSLDLGRRCHVGAKWMDTHAAPPTVVSMLITCPSCKAPAGQPCAGAGS